jgi:hypothetical protein
MRINYISIVAVLFLVVFSACEKEMAVIEKKVTESELNAELREPNQVAICHAAGNSGYNIIYVNENAVNAHLNHGDYLLNVDFDGDGLFAYTPCTEGSDCNDNDSEVTQGQTCEETDCCFCYFVEDIPWQIYLNVPVEAGLPVKGTQLIYGNPADGGATVQILYNGNNPGGWECTFVNSDYPTGSLSFISDEQAMECRNVLCKIATDLGLTNIFGVQSSTNELNTQESFSFFKIDPAQ